MVFVMEDLPGTIETLEKPCVVKVYGKVTDFEPRLLTSFKVPNVDQVYVQIDEISDEISTIKLPNTQHYPVGSIQL